MKFVHLVDRMFVTRNQVSLGQDDIQFSRKSRSFFGIKKGDMNSQKKAVFVLNYFWLVGWGNQLFESEWMNIEILLQICDIFLSDIKKIKPSNVFVFDSTHFLYEYFFQYIKPLTL